MEKIKLIREYALKCYNDANCVYGGGNYSIHIDMVVENVFKYSRIFNSLTDLENTLAAAHTHDCIEDAKQTYNDIKYVCGEEVADITLSVTDVPAENRLMKHLLTMGKTVKDHRAIILKMCDILANSTYSKEHGSSMHKKYVAEYAYRKPIFQQALVWYHDKLNQEALDKLWKELDEVHTLN